MTVAVRRNRRTTPREHGTQACYVFGEWGGDATNGCRCETCRAGNRARYSEWKNRTEPAYVSATPAREHLQWLAGEGVGLKQVAKVTGLSHGSLSKLVYGQTDGPGRKARPPSRRIRPATSQAILAVTPSDRAQGAVIPAAETQRNISRLLSRGWTRSAISRAIGQAGNALQIGELYVTQRNADLVKALVRRPVPADVGKAWSAHHQANTIVDEPAPPAEQLDDRDRVTLQLVELLEERIDQNAWRAKAACTGRSVWMFFPARGDHETLKAAKRICGSCFARQECLQANIDKRDGVYGGLSGIERRDLRRNQTIAEPGAA